MHGKPPNLLNFKLYFLASFMFELFSDFLYKGKTLNYNKLVLSLKFSETTWILTK